MIKNWTQWLCLEKCYCHFCEILNIKYNTWYKNIKFTSVQPFSVFKLLIQLFCWCRYFTIFSLTHLRQKLKIFKWVRNLNQLDVQSIEGNLIMSFNSLKRRRHSRRNTVFFTYFLAFHFTFKVWPLNYMFTFRCLSMHP